MEKGNYYLESDIDNTGVAEVQHPVFQSENFKTSYNPYRTNSRRDYLGSLVSNVTENDSTIGNIEAALYSGKNIEDLRAANQSALDMWGNALVNNLVIAGTTAVGGTLGLAWGLLNAAANLEYNRIWNNAVNNYMVDIQDATRENFTIHRGSEYDNKSIWEKLGTGVFWAEAFQNLGYAEGMIVPGMGVGSLLGSAPKLVQRVLPSFVASIGEGSIEAIHVKNDEIKGKSQLAYQEYQRKAANATSSEELGLLNNRFLESLNTIEEDVKNAGNFTFGSNIALLTATNALQFGKLFERGFGTAKRVSNNNIRRGITETSEGLYTSESKALATTKAVGKKLLDASLEGIEEVTQGIIAETPAKVIGFNEFNASEFNPEKRQLAADIWQGLGESFSQAMQDPTTAEEFASGFVIGMFGVPRLQAKKMPITLENSIFEEVRNARKQAEDNQRLVSEINNRLQQNEEIKSYYNGLVRHIALQDEKNAAIDKDDKYEYQSAESAQLISDIMMFDEVSGIDRLKEIINNSIDTSDEGIQAIIDDSLKNEESPFSQNGNAMSIEEVRNIILDKQDKINTAIDNYVKDKESLSSYSPALGNNAMKAALFIKGQLRDHKSRLAELSDIAYEGLKELSNSIPKKSKAKITKGEGTYVYVNGKKRLVRKDSIDHYDSNGNPIFKVEEGVEDPLRNKDTFLDNILNNPTYLDWVNNLLNSKDSTIPLDKRRELFRNLHDLIKLGDNIQFHNTNLAEILNNPDKADTIVSDNIKKAEDAIKAKKIENIKSSLNSITNIQELQDVINNISEEDKNYLSDAIEELKNSDNENLKELLENYEQKQELNISIEEILEDIEYIEDSPDKISVVNIVKDALDNSNNTEEFKNIIEEAIENDLISEDIKESLNEIIGKLGRHKSSKKASKKDSNKPKKKVKRKFSISELSDENDGDKEAIERGGSPEKESKIDWAIKKVESFSEDQLNKVTSGKIKFTFLTSEETKKIKKLARNILDSKRHIGIDPEDTEDTEDEDLHDYADVNVGSENNNSPALRSWYYTKYNIDSLKDRRVRRAEINDNPIVEALDDLGAFDFVDEGNLGILFNEDREIPIHFVITKDERLHDVVVLAIEVTKEVEKLVKTPKSFVAQDNKRYQAVGSLGYNSKSKSNYDSIIKVIKKESSNEGSNYFVSPSLTSKIKHIYSGRIVKTTDNNAPHFKPLRVLVKKPKLGVYYNGQLRVPGIDEYEEYENLNDNNTNIREGSVWLMTKEADGRYYAKAVKVKRFTEEEFPLDENYDTPIMHYIIDSLRVLINPNKSDYERSMAKYDLMSILYFPKNNPILFNEDSISIKGIANNIGEDLDIEEKLQAVLDVLQSEELNLRFQVSTSKLNDNNYVQDLLDSDILITDIAIPHNVNASFDMYLINTEDGTIIEDSKEDNPKGHTGRRGINNALATTILTLNGKVYSIKDGVITLDGKKVKSKKTKSELSLLEQITRGIVDPISEDSNLYIGNYEGGAEFGIINGTVISGKKLADLKSKNSKKEKNKKHKKNADELWEDVSPEELEELEFLRGNTKELEKTEDKKDDGFMPASQEDIEELMTLLNGESSEDFNELKQEDEEGLVPKKKIKKKKTTKSKKSKLPAMDEIFNPEELKSKDELEENISNPNFDALVRENRSILRDLGFRNHDDFILFISDKNNKLPSINTINSQEQFDNLVKLIKECK